MKLIGSKIDDLSKPATEKFMKIWSMENLSEVVRHQSVENGIQAGVGVGEHLKGKYKTVLGI